MNAVNITIRDGGLGRLPQSVARAHVKLGVFPGGTVNTLYGFGSDVALLDAFYPGLAVEGAVDTLINAGGPVYLMPVNPSVQGALSAAVTSVLQSGSTGAVAISLVPARLITVVCVTGGTLGTATFTFKLDSDPAGPVTTSTAVWDDAGWTGGYLVPGTMTVLRFTEGTGWDAGDTFTISTLGVITQTVNAGAGTGTIGSQLSSPMDNYQARVHIIVGGAIGTATFKYALDWDGSTETLSAEIATPSGAGKYQIPGTGVMLTFSGTFVAGDLFSFNAVPAGFSTSDVASAMDALLLLSQEWGFVQVLGMPASAAAAASLASTMDTKLTAAAAVFRYGWALVECPGVGTLVISGGAVIADTADTDSVVVAAFASFDSKRVVVATSDVEITSGLTARKVWRPLAWRVASRAAALPPGRDLSAPASDGGDVPIPLEGVTALRRDEFATPNLDQFGFVTARTYPNTSGFFISGAHTMTEPTSDYYRLANRRVVDVGCRTAYKRLVAYLAAGLRLYKSGEKKGQIVDQDANRIESRVNTDLDTALVNTTPADASSAAVTIDRSVNILATDEIKVKIDVVPLGYPDTISVDIGLVNPAAA